MIPRSKKGVFTENDLMAYFAIVVKHFRLMLLLGTFAILLGLTYYTYSRPVYRSISEISYDVLNRANRIGTSVDAQMAFKDSDIRFIKAQLMSSHLKERTARRLGLGGPAAKPSAKEIQARYVPRVIIRATAQDISIEVYAYSFAVARDWPEAMYQELILEREEQRKKVIDLAFETFSKEMTEMQTRMDQLFDSKYAFRNSNNITKITIELNHLKTIPHDLMLVKKKIGMMERTREIINSQNLDAVAKLSLLNPTDDESRLGLNVGDVVPKEADSSENGRAPSIVVIPTMMGNGGKTTWEELDYQRRELQRQYDDVGQTFLPKHPKMVEIRKKLDTVQRSLELELEVAVKRFELNYANLQNKERELANVLPAYNETMRQFDKATQEYSTFDEGQLSWRKMHAAMEKRLQLLDFGEDKERITMSYMGPSEELVNYPVSPNPMKLALYSILLGVGLAIAIPFLIEFLDSRISDLEHAEESLHIRGLGVVPKIDLATHEARLLSGGEHVDLHFQQNFHVIRTNLAANVGADSLPQVILITSAMPQEGKTMVSTNLAMSFASKGEETILIDADLRRGRLAELFKCNGKPGLSELLRDNLSIAEACRPGSHDKLTIMPCGKHTNSASDLLDSVSFTDLIAALRTRYKRIIVDTPPVLGLADATIIQRSADGILFVIWNEFTPARNVKTAIQTLQTNGGKLMGFVLNRLDFAALGNRYKYFYYAPSYYSNYKALEAPTVPEK